MAETMAAHSGWSAAHASLAAQVESAARQEQRHAQHLAGMRVGMAPGAGWVEPGDPGTHLQVRHLLYEVGAFLVGVHLGAHLRVKLAPVGAGHAVSAWLSLTLSTSYAGYACKLRPADRCKLRPAKRQPRGCLSASVCMWQHVGAACVRARTGCWHLRLPLRPPLAAALRSPALQARRGGVGTPAGAPPAGAQVPLLAGPARSA
jgi:hypothetical protein